MEESTLSKHGAPALLARFFGWSMLFVLVAFLINNVLTVGYGYPGALAGFGGGGAVQMGLYVLALILAGLLVMRTQDTALRWDARRISDFNSWLVRFFFFTVLFVGIADAVVAFLRVEGLWEDLTSKEFSQAMGRSRDVAYMVHLPLMGLAFVVSLFSRTLGFTWLALMIVAAELLIVISRFIFSYEQALMGDLVRYWYAALFLFASAHTLVEEGHVRVDVFYANFGPTKKGFVNAVGTILLGMTTAWVIIAIGFGGKQSIINSPVMNFEVSQAGATGMYIKYQMAAFIGIFAITMLIQFVSYFFEAVADRRGEPGRREIAPPSH